MIGLIVYYIIIIISFFFFFLQKKAFHNFSSLSRVRQSQRQMEENPIYGNLGYMQTGMLFLSFFFGRRNILKIFICFCFWTDTIYLLLSPDPPAQARLCSWKLILLLRGIREESLLTHR